MSVPLKISGGRQKREKAKEKSKYSCFLVTINTNQRYKADDQYMESDSEFFENIVRTEILEKLPDYVNVMQEGHSWSNDHIDGVDVDYILERGEKYNALHAHILIKIKHRSKVQLNYKTMKQRVVERLGLKNVYFDCKLVRPTSDDWLKDYIYKTV